MNKEDLKDLLDIVYRLIQLAIALATYNIYRKSHKDDGD